MIELNDHSGVFDIKESKNMFSKLMIQAKLASVWIILKYYDNFYWRHTIRMFWENLVVNLVISFMAKMNNY